MQDKDARNRWERIKHLPLPRGIGNLDEGLCAAARIAYAETGEVTAALPCAQVCLRSMIAANDALPDDLRQQLGSTEYRDALLRTSPGEDDRLRWIVAEQARQSAIRALRYAGVNSPAVAASHALPPNAESAYAYYAAAAAAADAAYAAAAADAEHQQRIADLRALLGLEEMGA